MGYTCHHFQCDLTTRSSWRCAILVDPDDVKDITKALITITSQTGLRDLLAKKGLERYQTFSWEESAQVIYHALLDMVKSKAK
ncbi:MAG: hypothetical protein IPN86_12470 [Saprospiraceae bacterium]|nr:hypothetical protein [Saprospiraceae bacterium]